MGFQQRKKMLIFSATIGIFFQTSSSWSKLFNFQHKKSFDESQVKTIKFKNHKGIKVSLLVTKRVKKTIKNNDKFSIRK